MINSPLIWRDKFNAINPLKKFLDYWMNKWRVVTAFIKSPPGRLQQILNHSNFKNILRYNQTQGVFIMQDHMVIQYPVFNIAYIACAVCSRHVYTRQKIINLFRVDENSIEKCFAAHIVQCRHFFCWSLFQRHM